MERSLLLVGLIVNTANDNGEALDDIFERLFAVADVNGSVSYVEPSSAEMFKFSLRLGPTSELSSLQFG